MPRAADLDDFRSGIAWLSAGGVEAKAAAAPLPATIGWANYIAYDAADGLAPTPADGPLYLNVAVAACLGWLDRNFATADLHVVGKDDAEIEGHPLVALLDRPNALDDFHTFWSSFLLSDVIDGNTFFVKLRNRGKGIHSLWWVPPWDVRIIPDPGRNPDRPVLYYEVLASGSVQKYQPEDVIHVKDGKDPITPFRGLAKLKAGLRSVSTIDRAELYTQTLMRNMGAVPYMLSPGEAGQQIDPKNVASLREQFTDRMNGLNNGKPFVSTQGMKLDRIGLSPEEMALDKIREFPVAAICALIGTPAMAVGLPDPGKTYSNLAEADRMAWQNGLIPRQARAAEAFDRQCPELVREGQRAAWDYQHVSALQDDWSTKIDGTVKAVGGPFMTKNEARGLFHLDPVADGDDVNKPAPPPGANPGESPDGGEEPARPEPKPKPAKKSLEVKAASDHAAGLRLLYDAAAPLGLAKALRDGTATAEQRRAACHAVGEVAAHRLREIGEGLRADLEHDGEKMARLLSEAVKSAFGKMRKVMLSGSHAATLALRGPEELAPDDRSHLASAVAKQDAYLEQFRAAVIDGTQVPDGTLASRAEMYGRAAWSVAHEVERAAAARGGYTEEINRLGATERDCRGCLAATDMGWVPIGTLPDVGTRDCRSNCRCWIDYR